MSSSSFLGTLLLLCNLLQFISPSQQASWPQQTFNTTKAQVPVVQVTRQGTTDPGYLFVTPINLTSLTGFSGIFTDDGDLVWHNSQIGFGLRPQLLHGRPVLTVWGGLALSGGMGWGTVSIYDDTYTLIKNVTLEGNFQTYNHAKFPSYIDIHEAQLTDDGTLLVTAVNITTANMTSVGGPEHGWVMDGLFYEIDVATNKVLFRWSAIDHLHQIPLKDSLLPLDTTLSGNGSSYENPWGYFHVNSVAKYGSNYLISSRLLCTIFYIDAKGDVLWRLSGRNDSSSNFTLDADAHFCYQHDARIPYMTNKTLTITMHDNGDTEYDNHTVTRGLSLDLDFSSHTASVNRSLQNPHGPVYAVSQGSYQDLTNAHVLLGHGAVPVLEEYDAAGNLVLLFQFGLHYLEMSYRGFRFPWVGRPRTPPAVSAYSSVDTGLTYVYMSWNGATEVRSWNIYAGSANTSTELHMAMSVPKAGFETATTLPGSLSHVQVEAVTYDGNLTKSAVVTVAAL